MRVYIQQYGKERTGTNYVKALLGRNFDEIVLFDNRLGSKHGPHREVAEWMREQGIRYRSDFETLALTDRYWRARNMGPVDGFDKIHQPISFEELIALADGKVTLNYIISIKDPYAAVVSALRWKYRSTDRLFEPPTSVLIDDGVIAQYCSEYNRAYSSYLSLMERQTVVARFEDLLRHPEAVFAGASRVFGMPLRNGRFCNIDNVVLPGVGVTDHAFDCTYYADRRYLMVLGNHGVRIVNSVIDWDVMGRYGYVARLGCDG